jgi:O-antigen ligase
MTPPAPRDRAATVAGTALPVAAIVIALGYLPALAAPFVEPKLAVLVTAGALGLGARAWAEASGGAVGRWSPFITRSCQALLVTTLLAALLAARRPPAGAPYAAPELVRMLALFGVALGAGLLGATADPAPRRRLVEAIVAGAGMVALVGLIQHLRLLPLAIPTISVPGSTFGNRNVAAEAVAMAIPFTLGLLWSGGATDREPVAPRERALVLAVVVVLLGLQLAYLAVARARGAWLGGVLGVGVFLVLCRPGATRTAVLAAVGLGALAVLAAAVPGRWTEHDSLDVKRFEPATNVVRDAVTPSSPVARTRFALWRRTFALFRSEPLTGVGPGNFAVLFPPHAEPNAAQDGVLSPTAVPRRAHDDLLERLAETGPLGLAALLALYAALGEAAWRRARRARRAGRPAEAAAPAACAGSVAAFAGCGLTGFPFAMPATVFLFGVAIGLLAVEPDDDARSRAARARPGAPRARLAAAVVGGLALTGALWWSGHRIAASFWLARGEASLQAGGAPADAEAAVALLGHAAAAAPRDFQVALLASAAELRAGHPPAAIADARRALELEPYSANAWEALARARLASGDAGGASQAADRALEILHTYPGALFTRAQAAARLGEEERAADARARLTALAATDADARVLLDTLVPPPAAPATP